MNDINLIVNNEYTYKQLYEIFKIANSGGIRVSKSTKHVLLFTKFKNRIESNPYKDSKISNDGEFIYTGMGLKGDQVVKDTNQNGKVCYSKALGFTLLYFVQYEPNKYIFKGEAENNGNYWFTEECDANNNIRKVVKILLKIKK